MAVASTDELLAVHEELLTLVRAGLPLDRGLKEFARDVPGRLRPLLEELAKQLALGREPSAALAGISSPEARVYGAVLAVGMKSGRPAEALEGIVSTVRRTRGFRSALLVEMIYPALVLLLGTGLIVFSLLNVTPTNVAASEGLDVGGPLVSSVKSLTTPTAVGLVVLATLLILLGLWFVPRMVSASPSRTSSRWRLLQQIQIWQALSVFLDHLALLVEHQTPLEEAIALAGNASAWPPLSRSALHLAQQVAQGQTRWTVEPPLPPVAGWLLHRPVADKLPHALRREAEHYRRRSQRRQRWLTVYLPMMSTLSVGVICLAVLVFINLVPLVHLYYQLSLPPQ